MRTEPLGNIGIEIFGLVSAADVEKEVPQIFSLMMDHSVVVMRGLNLNRAQYAAISRAFGECNKPNHYFNDKENPEIFLVTNQRLEDKKVGMFGDHELQWHANGASRKDNRHFGVGLYCDYSESTVETEWCDTRKAFSALTPVEQEELRDTEVRVGVADFSFYSMTSDDPELFVMLKQMGGWKPLVGRHPSGQQEYCLFHHHFIEEVRVGGKSEEKDIFINRYVDKLIQPKFIYSHRFRAGDLVISDQLYSIHRRGKVEGSRLLYRSAFAYDKVSKGLNLLNVESGPG